MSVQPIRVAVQPQNELAKGTVLLLSANERNEYRHGRMPISTQEKIRREGKAMAVVTRLYTTCWWTLPILDRGVKQARGSLNPRHRNENTSNYVLIVYSLILDKF